MPRVYELKDLAANTDSANDYFQDFDLTLSISCSKMQKFVEIETELQGVDPRAWEILKNEAIPFLQHRDEKRGWSQLFDILYEAYGYNYLSKIGCKEIKFVPRSPSKGIKTPDLRAFLGDARLICEIKRINISDEEISARRNIEVRVGENQLSPGFFDKLKNVLLKARDQLLQFETATNARRLVYVIIDFDDFTHESDSEYFNQIDDFIDSSQISDVEIVLHKRNVQNNT